jgi:hypothetical protein
MNIYGTRESIPRTLNIFSSPPAAEYGTDKPRSVITREGDNLRLRCPANGFPRPSVEWVREDEKTISSGAWEMSSLSGDTLNITRINRVHMGLWRCLADNGIGVANQTFQIDVYCEFHVIILNKGNFMGEGVGWKELAV